MDCPHGQPQPLPHPSCPPSATYQAGYQAAQWGPMPGVPLGATSLQPGDEPFCPTSSDLPLQPIYQHSSQPVPPMLLSHSPRLSAHRCPSQPVLEGDTTHSPVQCLLLRARDKSGTHCLCLGSGWRGSGRGDPPERNQQLNTFTSPLICRFCHKILLQRA